MLEYLTSQSIVPAKYRCHPIREATDNVLQCCVMYYPTMTDPKSKIVMKPVTPIGPLLTAIYWDHLSRFYFGLGRDGLQYILYYDGWHVTPTIQSLAVYFTFQEN